MSTTTHRSVDCFVCQKHRGQITVPGGAVYEDEVVYGLFKTVVEEERALLEGEVQRLGGFLE
jgi:hypothetical protein